MDEPLKKISRTGIYGASINDGKMLLIIQERGPYSGKFDFPGGGIEFGESIAEALRREFEEEVGMTFESFELLTNLTATIQVPGDNERDPYTFHQIGMIYRVKGLQPIFKDARGDLKYEWVDPDGLTEERCSSLLWKFIKGPLSVVKTPYKIIDLSHTLDECIPSWNGGCGFQHEIILDYSECTTDVKFRVQRIKMEAGIGTHLDAPAHCIPEGVTIDQLPITDFNMPCVMIDVSEQAHERYRVSVDDIQSFEKKYGRIQPGSFVMIRTGWEKYWDQPEKYRNNHIFPSVSREAAEFLLERQIAGLGIDTLSPDRPEDGYPVHAALLGGGKYIVENAANLSELPPCGSFILALPLKIKDGTESPVRLIALL